MVLYLSLLGRGGGDGPPPVKRQRDNAIYVTGLALDVTEGKLSELFGSIGVIKVRWSLSCSCA